MKKKNENIVPVDLIARSLSNEADSSELTRLEAWLAESDENRKIYSQYKTLWEKSGSSHLIDKIDVENEWQHFKKSQTKEDLAIHQSNGLTMFTRIAAAVLAGVIISLTALISYNSLKYEKIVAGSSLAKIDLPDGSKATLYPGSEIKYLRKFRDNRRDIDLSGEAFFNVIRDTLSAFSVSSGDMIVKVLGTTFNVEAFEFSEIFNVVVEEGRVAVFTENHEEAASVLEPGEKAIFTKSSNEISKTVNQNINYNSWRTRRVVFEDSDLNEIASTLSKVFVRDVVNVSKSEEQRITVNFDNRSLDYILETIEATLDIEIVRDGEKIIIK